MSSKFRPFSLLIFSKRARTDAPISLIFSGIGCQGFEVGANDCGDAAARETVQITRADHSANRRRGDPGFLEFRQAHHPPALKEFDCLIALRSRYRHRYFSNEYVIYFPRFYIMVLNLGKSSRPALSEIGVP